MDERVHAVMGPCNLHCKGACAWPVTSGELVSFLHLNATSQPCWRHEKDQASLCGCGLGRGLIAEHAVHAVQQPSYY